MDTTNSSGGKLLVPPSAAKATRVIYTMGSNGSVGGVGSTGSNGSKKSSKSASSTSKKMQKKRKKNKEQGDLESDHLEKMYSDRLNEEEELMNDLKLHKEFDFHDDNGSIVAGVGDIVLESQEISLKNHFDIIKSDFANLLGALSHCSESSTDEEDDFLSMTSKSSIALLEQDSTDEDDQELDNLREKNPDGSPGDETTRNFFDQFMMTTTKPSASQKLGSAFSKDPSFHSDEEEEQDDGGDTESVTSEAYSEDDDDPFGDSSDDNKNRSTPNSNKSASSHSSSNRREEAKEGTTPKEPGPFDNADGGFIGYPSFADEELFADDEGDKPSPSPPSKEITIETTTNTTSTTPSSPSTPPATTTTTTTRKPQDNVIEEPVNLQKLVDFFDQKRDSLFHGLFHKKTGPLLPSKFVERACVSENPRDQVLSPTTMMTSLDSEALEKAVSEVAERVSSNYYDDSKLSIEEQLDSVRVRLVRSLLEKDVLEDLEIASFLDPFLPNQIPAKSTLHTISTNKIDFTVGQCYRLKKECELIAAVGVEAINMNNHGIISLVCVPIVSLNRTVLRPSSDGGEHRFTTHFKVVGEPPLIFSYPEDCATFLTGVAMSIPFMPTRSYNPQSPLNFTFTTTTTPSDLLLCKGRRETMKVLQLTAGIGTFQLGMERSGFSRSSGGIVTVEPDVMSALAMTGNHVGGTVLREDIAGFLDQCTLVPSYRAVLGDFCYIHSSPSSGNNGSGGGEMEFASAVRIFAPPIATFEAPAESYMTLADRRRFQKMVSILLESGYQMHCRTLMASDYGDAAMDCRVVLWVSRAGQALPLVPRPTHGGLGLLPARTPAHALGFEPSCPAEEEPETLSVRQLAMLYSIPDEYKIMGMTETDTRARIQRSMPVQMASAVARSVYQALEWEYETDLADCVSALTEV